MPRITFIRHAKTTCNTEGKYAGSIDCDTTKEGLEAVKNKITYTSKDFEYIYCSPLKRTKQTLYAIMPNCRDIIVDNRIAERYLGEWENMFYNKVDETLGNAFSKGEYNPPKSETYEHFKKRVCNFVEELFEKYNENDRILVITHAGVIKQVRNIFLPNMERTPIENGDILVLTNENYCKYRNTII